MPATARQIAFEVLNRVREGGYADRSLDSALRRQVDLDPRDRGLATELVYGVLRQQNRLDFALDRLTKGPLARLEAKVLLLLRLGAYQILALDRVPVPVAVNETVNLARRLKLQRATGLINAVLRRLGREADQIPWPGRDDLEKHLTWTLSLPPWLAKLWLETYGDDAVTLAEGLLQPAPFTVRVNRLRIDRDALLKALTAAGHKAVVTEFAPDGVTIVERGPAPLPGQDEGWFQVQDEASMLIAPLLAPQPGELLADICAAPGGKTTHLATLAQNRARILAFDLHPHRVELINKGAERLGCHGIEPHTWDMTQPPPFAAPESLDGVLLDAPCSGLGVLRRNPDARWRLQPADLADLARRQERLLNQAAALVKPGGRLVYSVCTLTPAETDVRIEAFLATHPGFVREDLHPLLPNAAQELLDPRGQLRSWPARPMLDGFFACRLRRRD